MIAMFARSIPWADQPCLECKAKRPLSELVPVLDETTRVLVAWRCNGGCDE